MEMSRTGKRGENFEVALVPICTKTTKTKG